MGSVVVERLLIKEYLSFKEAKLEFSKGLVVFTGPSGAGKSILINALLALFGLTPQEAKLSEVVVDLPLQADRFGIETEDIQVVRAIKREKVRFFLNDQSISKKALTELFSPFVSYLNQKDLSFFDSSHILSMLDDFVIDKEHKVHLNELSKLYEEYLAKTKMLNDLLEKERKSAELKEFLRFEIDKIEAINPKEGEYEELMQIKKDLSKKEKIAEAIQRAEGIFEYEGAVLQALDIVGKSSDFFQSAMSELGEIMNSEKMRLEELGEMDVEGVLDRIEQLSSLKRRYGSIEEALAARDEKKRELERLENLTFEKEELQKRIEKLRESINSLSQTISKNRIKAAKMFESKINGYLEPLKLPNASIELHKADLGPKGSDKAVVKLAGVEFKKISSGEYNRLRLAFLAAWSDVRRNEGILILDEIDANISGEESMAVANILQKLSKTYQIFAISHQAQLASRADQHFLVTKSKGQSQVKELAQEERQKEIARIISGETITDEAMEFAKKLLKEAS